jgi:GT2 family glycosyltransferase
MRKQKLDKQQDYTDPGLLQKALHQLLEQIARRDQKILWLNAKSIMLAEKDVALRDTQVQLVEKESQLNRIVNSDTWKAVLLFRRIRDLLAPPNSRRASVLRQGLKFIIFLIKKIDGKQNSRRDLALIRASGLFDENWYLANNPDVAQAKMDPLLHYLHIGGIAGRDPGPQFSSSWYLNTYDDVKEAKVNPLVHYLKYRGKEPRLSRAVLVSTPRPVELADGYESKVSQPSRRSRFWSAPTTIPLKVIVRKVLLKSRIWISSRPALQNLIKFILPSRLLGRLNRAVQVDGSSASHFASNGLPDWDIYLQLSERIRSFDQARRSGFIPKQPQMVNLDEKNLIRAAQSLTIIGQENPEVSIIIPVHNNAKLTLECLTTIAQRTDEVAYEIIIVDDGSDADTVEILQTVRHISLIRHEERAGFSRSCNQGANAARANFLLFLNNDTQVMKGWLKPLLDVFSDKDRVGAVGPKVLFPDGRLQEAGCIINRNGTAELIGFVDDPNLPRYNFIREVDYCSGVSLMVNADVFREIGGFDELYSPAYYEDVDLCFKLRARGLKNFYCPDAAIIHHLSATANKIDSSFKLQLVARNRQKFLERWQEALDNLNRVKLIAFYLPQYHPIPENDLWWGKGFTEWANVARARPNYKGHYQPHLPADLGFYDLRVAEVMEQQVELAKRYNIYGFCYYYYWFNGKRILEMPLERMLETGKPDFPFCLCWANENWSRRWDGSEDDILLSQNHTDQDDRSVILDLIRYLRHPNYIRIDGKPMILIYRIGLFPDIQRTAQIWREVCREENLGEIHLVMAESFEHSLMGSDPHKYGLDANLEFPPHNMAIHGSSSGAIINPDFSGKIFNYRNEALKYVGREIPGYTRYSNVMPSWDNTARKQNGSIIFDQAAPGAYQAWLEAALQRTREQLAGDQRILFINAWNEWAEGNHLEPDQRYGHRYLEATRNAQEHFLLNRGS